MKENGRYYLTVGELRNAIKDVPDDVQILINVEEEDNENWDTTDATIVNDSYMCNGDPGCTHENPEMYWDIILFVRYPTLGEQSITSRR